MGWLRLVLWCWASWAIVSGFGGVNGGQLGAHLRAAVSTRPSLDRARRSRRVHLVRRPLGGRSVEHPLRDSRDAGPGHLGGRHGRKEVQ